MYTKSFYRNISFLARLFVSCKNFAVWRLFAVAFIEKPRYNVTIYAKKLCTKEGMLC